MDAERVRRLRDAGLDHIQLSIQASNSELNDRIAGSGSFEHKIAMAREVKANRFPMVLNFVIHRDNIDYMQDMLDLAIELEADYVELANTQYYGWASIPPTCSTGPLTGSGTSHRPSIASAARRG